MGKKVAVLRNLDREGNLYVEVNGLKEYLLEVMLQTLDEGTIKASWGDMVQKSVLAGLTTAVDTLDRLIDGAQSSAILLHIDRVQRVIEELLATRVINFDNANDILEKYIGVLNEHNH